MKKKEIMKQGIFTIEENKILAPGVYEMTLEGDAGAFTAPGQFANIAIDGYYLRRPISVCDLEEGKLVIIYKIVGAGTLEMSRMSRGEKLDMLTGLGNGYDMSLSGQKPVLIGGGVGIPPLFLLAKELIKAGREVSVVLGFNTKSEVFYEDEFRKTGCSVNVATVDGSYGQKGFATDALPAEYSYFYTCGPGPMLKAVHAATETSGQFSLEERMGCGFGSCMGCSLKTTSGYKRICADGPVFKKEEILWED